jgi:uncharacterized protein (TIGR00251 family)
MATLAVKVVPGARQSRVVGKYGDAIKIQVTAAPEHGKANQAVIAVLAEALGVSPHHLQILRGHTQPRKIVEVAGLESREIYARLGL